MKKLLISIAVVCAGFASYAQNFQSSQPFTAPLQVNPALMGPNQDIRANIGYRTQYADLDGFQTMRANVMMPVYDRKNGQLDVGLAFVNDAEGAFQTNDIKFAVGYDLQLERAHHLSVALSTGYGMRGYDHASQFYNDQYLNGEFLEGSTSAEVIASEESSWVNAGFGLLYYYTPPRDSISAFAGVSGQNVYNPTETYIENSNGVSINKYTFMTGVKLMTKENIDVTPHLIASRHGGAQNISAGLYIDYKLPLGWDATPGEEAEEVEEVVIITNDSLADSTSKKPKKPFIEKQNPKLTLGSWYHQHSNTVSILLGVRYDKFALGYSYDFAAARLRETAMGNSTHEITLSFMMPWSDKPTAQVFSIW